MQARFVVSEIISRKLAGSPTNGYQVVKLAASTVKDNNIDWAYYTPNGTLEMMINPEAAKWFEDRLGKILAVELTDLSPVV